MFRGTTPKIRAKIPEYITADSISQIWMTFSQNGEVILNKVKSDFEIEGQTAIVTLSQAETLTFDGGKTLEVQIRILRTNGEALASKKRRFRVEEILKDGEINA